jgi:hypothetical protein
MTSAGERPSLRIDTIADARATCVVWPASGAHSSDCHKPTAKNQLLPALTVVYLTIPVLIFACGWLRWPYAAVTVLLVMVAVAVCLKDIYGAVKTLLRGDIADTEHRIAPRAICASFVLVFLLLAAWLMLSGTGGYGHQNQDYLANNALLRELILRRWPLHITYRGSESSVVYYMGYYLPSALVGKWLGWNAANACMYLWTLSGTMLSFGWFWKLSRIDLSKRTTGLLWLAILFCFAGGLDYIGYYILKKNVFDISTHIEYWGVYFQYSGNTTLMFWVPQHAIAAWLIAGIVVDTIHERKDLKYTGIAIASSLLWSPFGVAGIAPYLFLMGFVYLRKENRRFLFHPLSAILFGSAFWVGGILFLFITSNRFEFPSGFIWNLEENPLRVLKHLLAFTFLEYLFLAFLILLFLVASLRIGPKTPSVQARSPMEAWRHHLKRQFDIDSPQFAVFLVVLGVLLLLPMYRMGSWNDFVMRASIPSLFVFWAFVGKVSIDSGLRARTKLGLLHFLILVTLLVGSFAAIAEVARSIEDYHFGPPDIVDVSELHNVFLIEQRLGEEDSLFYTHLAR